jgi:hypothetical protein
MSTHYRSLKDILVRDLLDGRLAIFGIREHAVHSSEEHCRCITDGDNYIWVLGNSRGCVEIIRRTAGNLADYIVSRIAECFEAEIVSEYEPQYWGFDTDEEWEAAEVAFSKEHEDEYYAELMKYVAGEPNDIQAGTIGAAMADIALQLVRANADLTLPANRDELLERITTIYERDPFERKRHCLLVPRNAPARLACH